MTGRRVDRNQIDEQTEQTSHHADLCVTAAKQRKSNCVGGELCAAIFNANKVISHPSNVIPRESHDVEKI